MQLFCAICRHVGEEPSMTRTVLGLRTAHSALLDAAITEYDDGEDGLRHVLLPVCPEHAVDVYRGRVAGVEVAWRLPTSAHAQLASR